MMHGPRTFPDHELSARDQARDYYLRDRESATDKCGYCNVDVIWRELLPAESRVFKYTSTKIVWSNNGKIKKGIPATVEHIVPLSEGGGNLKINLMAACFECNQQAAADRRNRPRTKEKTRILKGKW